MAGHIAVEAERTGFGPVALIDTDPQGSLADWWNERSAETPLFAHTFITRIRMDLDAMRNAGIRLLVFDTPPAITATIETVIEMTDLVVIPARPSPQDLRAAGATVEIVERCGKQLVFVVNAATRGARITSEAAIALSQHGTVAPVTIHQRTDFAASMIDGRSVMELDPHSQSAQEVSQLWQYISSRLNRNYRRTVIQSGPGPRPGASPASPGLRPAWGFANRDAMTYRKAASLTGSLLARKGAAAPSQLEQGAIGGSYRPFQGNGAQTPMPALQAMDDGVAAVDHAPALAMPPEAEGDALSAPPSEDTYEITADASQDPAPAGSLLAQPASAEPDMPAAAPPVPEDCSIGAPTEASLVPDHEVDPDDGANDGTVGQVLEPAAVVASAGAPSSIVEPAPVEATDEATDEAVPPAAASLARTPADPRAEAICSVSAGARGASAVG